MEILEALNWRYATKTYDPAKKVSQEDLETIMEATRLSVSSMGLQPYKILIVEDPRIREQLKPHAFGQNAITDASHLFIFASEDNVGKPQIDAYLENISKTRSITLESLDGFNQMMHNFVGGLSKEAKEHWTEKQSYIALATLINTASMLRIDATPMEGFDADAFDRILNLKDSGLSTAVIASVGYRHEADNTQHYKKVRKSKEELFITL